MTNTQLMLSIGLPMLTILLGILLAQKGIADMKGGLDRMDGRFDRIEGRLDRIDTDLRQFFSMTGRLEARMDSLEKRQPPAPRHRINVCLMPGSICHLYRFTEVPPQISGSTSAIVSVKSQRWPKNLPRCTAARRTCARPAPTEFSLQHVALARSASKRSQCGPAHRMSGLERHCLQQS
jgi:hypothetical protein